jgi:translation initiation factor IF-2
MKHMAKARKPFISRKRRKEIDAARERREKLVQTQVSDRATSDSVLTVAVGDKQPVQLPPLATVGEFAQLLNVPVVKVISRLVRNGIMAAVNDTIDYDTMGIVADEFGFIAEVQSDTQNSAPSETLETQETTSQGKDPRPPVVTIMGHVDHGKTSLLDKIRQTNIVAREHGGITQHIGAYQAQTEYEGKQRVITFLDTPGHEAFSALRSHGAQVTDIVILVVAADDGVKPQTIEALNHAKGAGVPIIVALTKIDLPSANIDRVKQQLTEYGLIPEEWGGDTIMTGVSSVTGDGMKQLLEYILLTADLKQYKADASRPAQGVIIESHQEVGLGPVATVLVQNGTLRVSDVVVVGQTYGKIRSMVDYLGKRVATALPATPVRISGLEAVPQFGESFVVVASEKEARDYITRSPQQEVRRGISDISQAIAEGRTDSLKIIIKADAQGSAEALKAAISKMEEPGVKPVIIQSSIGEINLSDIQLAAASTAVIFGFNVAIPPQIKKAADNQGVTIMTFRIIYDLLNQIEMILKGLVKMETIQVEKGRVKVLKIFRTSKEAQIVGGEITKGTAVSDSQITIMRSSEEIGKGKVISLHKGPESIKELDAGQECGLSIQSNTKIMPGDMLVISVAQEVISAKQPQ